MRKPTTISGGTILALHRAGGRWSAVTARHDGRLTSRPEITGARRFSDADGPEMRRFISQTAPDTLLVLVPAGEVVCRTSVLPNSDADQLHQALTLQAEAHLPTTIPPHRIALGVLPIAPGETNRCGLTLAWPEHAAVVAPELDDDDLPKPRFTPEPVALAALLDRDRPADPLVWFDQDSGAVAIALAHGGGVQLRSARETPHDPQDAGRVARMIAETALNVGLSGSAAGNLRETYERHLVGAGADGQKLVIPGELLPALTGRIEGCEAEGSWWDDYGLAVGAIIAACGPLASLTTMERDAIIERASIAQRLTRSISSPRRAVFVAVGCLILMALAPIAVAALRVGLLKLRHPDLESQVAAVDRAEGRLVMYRALQDEGWSTAKILADVACNTPEGIDLSFIRLQDRTFSVAGIVRAFTNRETNEEIAAPALLQRMQKNLEATGVFENLKFVLREPDNLGVHEFDLSASVKAPHRRHDYPIETDFGAYTLADRKYGDGPPTVATADAETSSTPDDPVTTAPPPARTPDPDPPRVATVPNDSSSAPIRRTPGVIGAGPSNNTSGYDEENTTPLAGSEAEPLSAEQIAAMSMAEVNVNLSRVADALKRARSMQDSDELIDRLKTEFRLLFARKREENG